MTYQYVRLAIGRKKQWRDVAYTVPCDKHGAPLSFNSETEEEFSTWTKKVISYEIRNNVMYCCLAM